MRSGDRAHLPVLVVGAGPTGLTVALLLARLGVPCTVVDKQAAVHPLPRAVHVDDEVVRILQRLGVDRDFAAISRPAAGLRLLDARLRPFAEFRRERSPGRHGHPEANLFDQPDLERLLLDRLARCPGVVLRRGVEVTSVAGPSHGPVRVQLRGTAGGPVEQLWAGFVLGCDGAGSTVRDAIGSRLRDLRFTERWFVLDARCRRPLPSWGGVDQVCDPRRAATFMALTGDRYRWEFRMHPGEDVADLTRPERIAELVAPWHVPELEVVRAAAYTFRARVADRWRAGRVLLLGDAAHQTPPFIGQGLGAGLRDAHALAWKVATVLAGPGPGNVLGEHPDEHPDEDVLLDSYQAERGPQVEAVIRGAVRVGWAMTGGQGVVAALRRPAAGLLLRLPGARAAALRGITTRYRPGAVVDPPRHRRDLTGTLCPQPLVGVHGERIRLDDVLGDGYALLTAGPVPPALGTRASRLGARTLRIDGGAPGPPWPGEIAVADEDGVLRAWLRSGRAGAVLLRPDRVVRATVPP